jgi:hypothetical protein
MFAIQSKSTKEFFTNGDLAHPNSNGNWSKAHYWIFKNATHAQNALEGHGSFWVDPGVDCWHRRAALENAYDIVRMDGKTFNFMAL